MKENEKRELDEAELKNVSGGFESRSYRANNKKCELFDPIHEDDDNTMCMHCRKFYFTSSPIIGTGGFCRIKKSEEA